MITDENQEKRLKEYNINIKTIFRDNDKVVQRNTDNSLCQDVNSGIIIEKDYYYRGHVIKKENIFDSRILYSYQFRHDEDITCINCGMNGKIDEFRDGCPYCHTSFNIEYDNKELGSKHYYDLTIKNRSYIIKTFIIDYIVSFILTLLYIFYTSRTFYIFDILKVIVISILISLLLFYFFYYFDALIIMPGIRKKKELQNKKQIEFWNKMKEKGFDKVKFYNNFNYDLRRLFYSDKYKDIIDYDIIDYNIFELEEKNDKNFVFINIDIRIVRFNDGKITSSIMNKDYKLVYSPIEKELKGGVNLIKCHNCGASINVLDNECSYCGSRHNYYQEWYLED